VQYLLCPASRGGLSLTMPTRTQQLGLLLLLAALVAFVAWRAA
jgi:hypothetical protein